MARSSKDDVPSQSADNAWKANSFNRGFALYMIVALIVIGLILAYFLINAAKQASPGQGAHPTSSLCVHGTPSA